jgi:hypothetical protein
VIRGFDYESDTSLMIVRDSGLVESGFIVIKAELISEDL